MSAAANHAPSRPVRVFLTHAPLDNVLARKVRRVLFQRTNAQVFTTEDLSAGEEWEKKLRKELSSADIVVALLTPKAVDSSWVLHEIGAAWALQKPIIPLITRRDVLNKMPVPLEGANAIELTDLETAENEDKFIDAFEAGISALAM